MALMTRPIWDALNTGWSAWAEGDASARLLSRDLGMFAAARDSSPESLVALGRRAARPDTRFKCAAHAFDSEVHILGIASRHFRDDLAAVAADVDLEAIP